jgi:hypothetical protein
MRARAIFVAAAVLAALAPAPARAAKPEPPLAVSLELLAGDASRGRYRVAVRLRSGVPLEDAALVVRIVSREAGARGAQAATRPWSREPVALPPGREVRRELEILTGAQEPVTVLVGVGGRSSGLRLHRTRGLDLGPETPPAAGTVRTDQDGRTYYELRMAEPPR